MKSTHSVLLRAQVPPLPSPGFPSVTDVSCLFRLKKCVTVGIEADDERLNKVISELNGKDINEVMNSGLSKLASVPAGGAVAAPAAAAAAGAAGAGAAPAAAEEKKEEKKEESEESDEDMGFGLFD
ncbi:60S acidic ribosomal protein P2-like protein [Lates japonicus]|uniref:Large ribosomal subunit protein P2 n=1 Tax=Lates japonicus TaxID=270547 RepID=A0AAD3RAB1_LATJO|nr:60S acidic ribosomal protein P2-like protein [Lates japonicus]